MEFIEEIRKKVIVLFSNHIIRYVFFGGCTTMVNLLSFHICLNVFKINLNISNIISIILAILFAYIVNSKYVFLEKHDSLISHIKPFIKFIGARAVTMVIEMAGVPFFIYKIEMNEMAGKVLTNVIVLILNYIFSKFFVFTSGKVKSENH